MGSTGQLPRAALQCVPFVPKKLLGSRHGVRLEPCCLLTVSTLSHPARQQEVPRALEKLRGVRQGCPHAQAGLWAPPPPKSLGSSLCCLPPSPPFLPGLAQPGRAGWFRVLSHLLRSCSRLCRMCDTGRCGWQEMASCTEPSILPCPQGQHLGPIPKEAPVVSPAEGCGGQAGAVSLSEGYLKWPW